MSLTKRKQKLRIHESNNRRLIDVLNAWNDISRVDPESQIYPKTLQQLRSYESQYKENLETKAMLNNASVSTKDITEQVNMTNIDSINLVNGPQSMFVRPRDVDEYLTLDLTDYKQVVLNE